MGKALPGCSGEGTGMGSAIILLLQGPNTLLLLQPQTDHLFPLASQYIPVQMPQTSFKGSFCTSDDHSYLFWFKKQKKKNQNPLLG